MSEFSSIAKAAFFVYFYNMLDNLSISVVIPCYRVRKHIIDVLKRVGPDIKYIYCVDDACPDKSGDFIERQITDPRVIVIRHTHNQGVGAAVLTGYHAALKNNDDIIVKIDGDGQMDPGFISKLVEPILSLDADYTKANRFYNLEFIQSMPIIRKIGNALLSFMNKFSTGYWDIFDPTNGFTAIHAKVLRELNFNKIAKGYFFETDLLFRLNIIRAVVRDIPCKAHYGNEKSQLKIKPVIAEFMWGHCRNFFKRILYNYFLRNFTIGSLEILFALILVPTGILKGLYEWHLSGITGEPVSAGAVMLSALPVILGFQFLFVFFNQDIQSVPRTVLHPYLKTNEEK